MCTKKSQTECIDCGVCIDYRSKRCQTCYKKHLQNTKQERKNKQKEYQKSWYQNNKEKVLERTKERANNLSFEQRKGYTIKSKYGITLKEYEELLVKSNHECNICGKKHTQENPLHIDHDHKTGKVRGLLCKKCNFGLGNFEDSINLLGRAIKYLKYGFI